MSMTNSKLWFAMVLVLVLSVSVFAFDLELKDSKDIIGEEISPAKPVEEVKYCIRADTKQYMPCDGFTKGEIKVELKETEKLLVSMEGTYLFDLNTRQKELWASKEEASVYVHKVRIDDRGQRVYHVDNLNPVPVDAYVKFWYEEQPGMLWHQNKYDEIVRGYYPSDWTWEQEYVYDAELDGMVPFGGTLTFLAYGLTENSVGSEEFLVGSFNLDDRFYGNNTIVNQANLLVNGSGFGKQFYPGNVSGGVTIQDGAMQFNGVDGRVNLGGNLNDFGTDSFSIGVWFKQSEVVSGTFKHIIASLSSGNTGSYFIRYGTNDELGISILNGTASINKISAGKNTDDLYFVVGVVDRTNNILDLYINGLKQGTGTTIPANFNTSSNINTLLGARNPSSPSLFFKGDIYSSFFFNKVLSQSEITALYNAGKDAYSPVGNGLIAQYSGRDSNWNGTNVTTIYDTNHLVSSGPITIPNGTGVWAQPYNLSSKTGITFDGVDDYINTNLTGLNSSLPFAISFWVKTTETGVNRGILGRWVSTDGQRDFGFLKTETSPNNTLRFTTTSAGTLATVTNLNGDVITDGNWHHVVGLYDGTQVKLYQNGLLKSNATVSGVNSNASNNLFIGRFLGATSEYFNGSLSDVRIYNTSLTPQQVYALYSGQNISTPAIFVSSPNNGQTIKNTQNVPLNFVVSGVDIQNVTYSINGVNTTANSTSNMLSLAEGSYTIIVYATNFLGQVGSTTVNFIMGDVNACSNTVDKLATVILGLLLIVGLIIMFATKLGGLDFEELGFIWAVIVTIAVILVTGLLLKIMTGYTCLG